MDTSLSKFENIIRSSPLDRSAAERFVALVADALRHHHEYTFEHLLYALQGVAPEVLALILDDMVKSGLIRQVYRVESAQLGGIEEFPSIEDVPEEIHDWRTDQYIPVHPEDLRVVFEF